MFLKLCFTDIKKNRLINICFVLQLTVIMVLAVLAVSTVNARIRNYYPFKNYFENKGAFCVWDSSRIDFGKDFAQYVSESLIKSESMAGAYMTYTSCKEYEFSTITYDDEIFENYQPVLSSGRWLTKESVNEAVITQNNYNLSVGDELTIIDDYGESKYKIVGILKQNTPIPGYFTSKQNGEYSYKDFYYAYNHEFEERPMMILSKGDYYKVLGYQTLIRYNESITEEEILMNEEKLYSLGCLKVQDMRDISTQSKKVMKKDLSTLVPILISLLLLCFITTISTSVLAVKKQLRDYSIMYMCGAQWRRCTHFNLVRTLITSLVSVILVVIAIKILYSTNINNMFFITINFYTYLIITVIIGLNLILSAIMLRIIINRTSPVQVFKANHGG